jgi:hypothetical protein
VEKGGAVAKVVLMTLAQMNEKLSVLEKSMLAKRETCS